MKCAKNGDFETFLLKIRVKMVILNFFSSKIRFFNFFRPHQTNLQRPPRLPFPDRSKRSYKRRP